MNEQTWTLLLTDVVDSTQMTEVIGDAAMAALWVAHDRVARDLLRRWRGREIDRSDGFLLLFKAVDDAVAYALAYHRALAALEPALQARVGLHTGPTRVRKNNAEDVALGAKLFEVEGLVKPLAARVMSQAQAGQTLLSASARDALGATTLQLQSHGFWRMKGLAEPIELFEVGDEAARFTPPPDATKGYRVVRQDDLWLPLREVRHGLPAERDKFVGRQEALLELARRFESGVRLVSLLGIGGGGKTRLATRFAWTWLGEFPGGCWFCDLSPARDIDGMVSAVAKALDVPLGKTNPVVQLGNAIAGRGRCLLILDNFEQVTRHADATLGNWLERAGEACFLVTTREVLGIAGEQALALAPLNLADGEALFTQRALAAKSDFDPPAPERAAVGPLVKLLDGLPLAIELCAARVRLMPPSMLLKRMSERFGLLSSGGGRPDRQATLRATFDWSWELLAAHEKSALAQLSVFEGGFTLEASESVLDLSAFTDAPLTMDVVQSLVDKSLVTQSPSQRLNLLVSVQEYAAQRLRPEGGFLAGEAPDWAAAQARHGHYFAGLDLTPLKTGTTLELDNLIAACRRSVLRGDAELAVATLERACISLLRRGPFALALELALQVKAIPALAGPGLALAGQLVGKALSAMGQRAQASDHLSEALGMAREHSNPGGIADTLIVLASVENSLGNNDDARIHLDEALELARELKDELLEARALTGMGYIRHQAGLLEEAHRDALSALDCARAAADPRQESLILELIGTLQSTLGRQDKAYICIEQALKIARQIGDRKTEATTLCNLSVIQTLQGRQDYAPEMLQASLVIARDLGLRALEAGVLANLGLAHEAARRNEEALNCYAPSIKISREIQDRRSEGQILGYQGRCHALLGNFQLGREQLDVGAALLRQVNDPMNLALLLCCKVEAEHAEGNHHAAAMALKEAESLALQFGFGPDSEINRELAKARKLVAEPSLRS